MEWIFIRWFQQKLGFGWFWVIFFLDFAKFFLNHHQKRWWIPTKIAQTPPKSAGGSSLWRTDTWSITLVMGFRPVSGSGCFLDPFPFMAKRINGWKKWPFRQFLKLTAATCHLWRTQPTPEVHCAVTRIGFDFLENLALLSWQKLLPKKPENANVSGLSPTRTRSYRFLENMSLCVGFAIHHIEQVLKTDRFHPSFLWCKPLFKWDLEGRERIP